MTSYMEQKHPLSQVHSDSFSIVCHLTTRSTLRATPTKITLSQKLIQLVSEKACDFRIKFDRARAFVETSGNCVVLFSVSSTTRDERVAF